MCSAGSVSVVSMNMLLSVYNSSHRQLISTQKKRLGTCFNILESFCLLCKYDLIGASKPDCVLCQYAAGMSSGWSNAAGRFCVMFLKNMVKKPPNI